jgi:Lipase (class 3)
MAGHGVGAAIANLLAIELLVDYGNEFPVRLRTFGAPRLFTMSTAASIKKFHSYNKMSFTRYEIMSFGKN